MKDKHYYDTLQAIRYDVAEIMSTLNDRVDWHAQSDIYLDKVIDVHSDKDNVAAMAIVVAVIGHVLADYDYSQEQCRAFASMLYND